MKKFFGFLRFLKAVVYVMYYAGNATILNIFGKGESYLRKRTGPAAKRLMKITGAKFTIEGLENINPDKTYVFTGNHRSYTDILVLFMIGGEANCQFTFMAKKELFRIPFLGPSMKAMRVIGVDRGSTSKAMKSLLQAIETVKEGGRNLIIFPEGTRSNDGRTLGPFKKGAFTIAKKAELDILPFVLEGTETYMPKKGFGMYDAEIKIRFFPAISTKDKTDAEVMKETEDLIKEALCQK